MAELVVKIKYNNCLVSLFNFDFGEGFVVALVEESQIVVEILYGVVEDGFGLFEGEDIDEILIVEVHLIDACHDSIEFFFFAGLCLLNDVGLIDDGFLIGFVVSLFAFACHLNIK